MATFLRMRFVHRLSRNSAACGVRMDIRMRSTALGRVQQEGHRPALMHSSCGAMPDTTGDFSIARSTNDPSGNAYPHPYPRAWAGERWRVMATRTVATLISRIHGFDHGRAIQ